ncbi:Gei-8p [Cichlidogyrus casuarinus]|uniref:Gei-8p n=1 Tax=Cichlidogyrus casuarinus TaxID=1844966 RepID=A0ABD2Q3H6_9PLAT
MGQMYSSPGPNLKDRSSVQNYYGREQMAENLENSDLTAILRNTNLRNIAQNPNQPAPCNFHEPVPARQAVQPHQESTSRAFDQNAFQQLLGTNMEPVLQTLKAQGVGSVSQNQLYELFGQLASQQSQQMSARSSPQNFNSRQFHSSVSPSSSSRPPSNSNASNYQRLLHQQQQQQQQQQQDASILHQMSRRANATLSPVPKRPRVMGQGQMAKPPENQAQLNNFYLLQRHLDQTGKQPQPPKQPQQPQRTVPDLQKPRHAYMGQNQPSVLHPHPHHQFLAHQVHASQLRADDHSLYSGGSISHSSVTPHGSGNERERISAKLKTLSEDISKQEVFHRSLTERESKLANSLKKCNTMSDLERVRIPSGTRVSSHTGIPIQSIIAQNKAKARQQHRILAKLCGKWVRADSLSLPLYRQPADLVALHHIEQRFHNGFKQKLINHLRRRQQASNTRLRNLSNRYLHVHKFYRKKVERLCNSVKRKQKDARHREIFEKIFPEIKKSRDERIPSSDDGASVTRHEELRLSSSGGTTDESGSSQYDPVAEVAKMKEYAIDPPVLLAPWERKYEFVCKAGLVHDAQGQHSATQNLSSWTDEEKIVFKDRYMVTPKNFSSIASYLERKSVADCILYYYKSKRKECYKSLVKKNARKRRAAQNERNAATTTASTSNLSSLETSSIEPNGCDEVKEEESIVTSPEKRGKMKVAAPSKQRESDEVKTKTPKREPSVTAPVQMDATTVSAPSSSTVSGRINDLIHISIDKNIMTSQPQQQQPVQRPEPAGTHQFALSAKSLLQQKQSAPTSSSGPTICPVSPPVASNDMNPFNVYSQPPQQTAVVLNYGGAAAANSRLDLLTEKISSLHQKSQQQNKPSQSHHQPTMTDFLLNAIGPENIRSGNVPMDQLSHILAKLINSDQASTEQYRRAQAQQQRQQQQQQDSNVQMYKSPQQRLPPQAPLMNQQQRLVSQLSSQSTPKQQPPPPDFEHSAQPTSSNILLENFLTAQQLGGRQVPPAAAQKMPFESGQQASSQFYQLKQQQQQQFRPVSKAATQANEAQLLLELVNALSENQGGKNSHHLATLLASVVASAGGNSPVVSSILNALNPSSSSAASSGKLAQQPQQVSEKNAMKYSPLSPSSPQEDNTRSLSKDLRSYLSAPQQQVMYSSMSSSMEDARQKKADDEEADAEDDCIDSSAVSTLTATTIPGQKVGKVDEDQDLLEDLQSAGNSTDQGLFPPPAAVNYSAENTHANYMYRKRGYTDSQVSLRCQVAGRNRESKKAQSPDTFIGQGEATTSFANVNLMSSSVLPSDQVSMETASVCSPSAMEKDDLKGAIEEALPPVPPPPPPPPPSDIVEDLIKSQLSKNIDEPPHVALTSITMTTAAANAVLPASSTASAMPNETPVGQAHTLRDHINKAIQESMRPLSEDLPPAQEDISPHHPMQTSPISPGSIGKAASESNPPKEDEASSDEASSTIYNLKIDLYPDEKAPSPYQAD